MRKTNPILRLRIADSGQTCAGTQPAARHPGSGGSIVRNEPNLPTRIMRNKANWRGRKPVAGRRLYKQTQLPKARGSGKCLAGRELWWIGHATGYGKTKPIPDPAGRDEAWGTRDVRCGTNKANWPRTGREDHRQGLRPCRCHPCGRQMCKTNPIPGGAGRHRAGGTRGVGKTCKTNPISGAAGWDEGVSCETKPIRRVGRMIIRPYYALSIV